MLLFKVKAVSMKRNVFAMAPLQVVMRSSARGLHGPHVSTLRSILTNLEQDTLNVTVP